MRYDFTIFYKIRKSAGNHGLLLAYDATKFQLLDQKGITFKNLFGDNSELHSQVATIYKLIDKDPFNERKTGKKIKDIED